MCPKGNYAFRYHIQNQWADFNKFDFGDKNPKYICKLDWASDPPFGGEGGPKGKIASDALIAMLR